jgi:hypothetical protein
MRETPYRRKFLDREKMGEDLGTFEKVEGVREVDGEGYGVGRAELERRLGKVKSSLGTSGRKA